MIIDYRLKNYLICFHIVLTKSISFTLSGWDEIDLEESIWWLKQYPIDLIDWRVENKHRKDLVKLNHNFRKQDYVDLLLRDERPYHLHNAAFENDGESDGYKEYSS